MTLGTMTLTVERVTPTIAAEYLLRNTQNRPIRAKVCEQYARDMTNGHWLMKPVAICFDEHGVLSNGQHTLTAITLSGLPQTLLVARNVPRAVIGMMDTGLRRTIADISALIGGEPMSGRVASVSRIVAMGPQTKRTVSFYEVFDAYQTHRDVINFAVEAFGNAKTPSTVIAVVARAAYAHDRVKLARFAEIMRTGITCGEHESAAVRLRDTLANMNLAGGKGRSDTYAKASSALDHFLRGNPITRLYGTQDDLFPLPEDESALAVA